GGEVLDVVADVAAQLLDQPVEQRREVDRVPCCALVVVASWVGRGAVFQDLAVGVAGESEEHRRPEPLAIRRGVDLPGRAVADRPLRQGRGVLAAAGRPGPPFAALRSVTVLAAGVAGDAAADSGAGELVVQIADHLVQLGCVVAVPRRCRGGPGPRRAGGARTPWSR